MITLFAYMMNQNANNVFIKTQFDRLTPFAKKQVDCLAQNIYHEARNEPEQGKVAVAFVTINRVKSGEFPDTICGVVEQKINSTCQFSWFCEETPRSIYLNNILTSRDDLKYNEIRNLALNVYANYEKMFDPTYGSLFYHADYVRPMWRNVKVTTQIGAHIFYVKKEKI